MSRCPTFSKNVFIQKKDMLTETMKTSINYLLTYAAVILVIFLVAMATKLEKQKQEIRRLTTLLEASDTTKTTEVDTLYLTKVIRDSVPKETTVTVYIRDTLYQKEGDSVAATPVIVTMKKKSYSNELIENDDTISYQAEVTGWSRNDDDQPRLDDINFTIKHRYYNTTNTIEINKPRNKKLKPFITPVVTVGYDPLNKQWGTMVGLGIGINKR